MLEAGIALVRGRRRVAARARVVGMVSIVDVWIGLVWEKGSFVEC